MLLSCDSLRGTVQDPLLPSVDGLSDLSAPLNQPPKPRQRLEKHDEEINLSARNYAPPPFYLRGLKPTCN
jgi:hypothetical protein